VSVPVRYIVGVNLSSFISVKYIDFVQVWAKLITEHSMWYVQ
jgi:hypothetical protein